MSSTACLRSSVKYRKAVARLDRARRLALVAQSDIQAAIESHVGTEVCRIYAMCSVANGDSDPIWYWPRTLDEAVAEAVAYAAVDNDGGDA